MATLVLFAPNATSSPFSYRPNSRTSPLLHRPHHHHNLSRSGNLLGRSLSVTRFAFKPGFLPEPHGAEDLVKDLLSRADAFLYTIADAAVSSSDTVTTTAKQNNDWLSGITGYMESVLKVLKDGLSALHVPYAYGFAIILLTILVKAATFPLTKKQVESSLAMRSLQPQIKAIQQRYAGDQERIQLETARLYKLAGINPLAGCLPTLATIPVWIGLYRALSNVADEGLLAEGFFWIPSLAGPTTIAARQNGSGISWLFPFVDGHPPLGWSDTLAYLVLPVLLVITQYISVQIMQSSQPNDPSMKSSQALTKFLPLMIGYFALSVPSGLSLYWFTNNILSTAQQVWLQKLGGAKNPVMQVRDKTVDDNVMQIQKSVSELEPPKIEASLGEKSTSEGPKPGDRFKQIKEQEEKRRRQREEEKRKAEEAAAKATEVHEARDKKTEVGDEDGDDGIAVKSDAVTANDDPSTSGIVVNGNPSSEGFGRYQKATSALHTENKGSADYQFNERNERSLEKETEVYTPAATDSKTPVEDPDQVTKD
ncbi:ALBINO3-like protein 1, chloroplastic [Neltuma alba]|uniref:ALBINO3-like protein 1, chloroplastic n=1 Tax=Neltuma alba TaxID=207710 RepID=UPI0010A37156|nr:ALBINO3-like protein 1, chloroplastic [Prosopis alba]